MEWVLGKSMLEHTRTALIAFSATCCVSKQRSSQSTSRMLRSAFARAKLLRARRIHASGAVGSVMDIINYPPFFESRPNDGPDSVAVTLDVLRGHHDGIYRHHDPEEVPVDFSARIPAGYSLAS